MTISHNYKMIFIHVQRTGGSSIISSLKRELGNNIDIISQHGNPIDDEKNVIEYYNYYYKFGFVRNPWERIFSWYSLLHKWDKLSLEEEKLRFENYLFNELSEIEKEDPNFFFNQLDYFKNENGVLEVDRIGRYERYDKDFEIICKEIGLPKIEIPINNNTSLKNYALYYSQKSKDLISEKCKEDIEYFNYAF